MDDEPYRTRSVVAKRARLSVDASATTEEATEERRGTGAPQPSSPPTTFRPRPRIPPDASRYVALWNKGAPTLNDGAPNNLETTAVSSNVVPSLSTILDELDLAEHNREIWERIEVLQRTINECEHEIGELRRELDVRTACLPRLLWTRNRSSDRVVWQPYWNDDAVLPNATKNDPAFAWALVRGAASVAVAAQQPQQPPHDPPSRWLFGDYNEDPLQHHRYYGEGDGGGEGDSSYGRTPSLPLRFQDMLWSKQRCRLRSDRHLLLASLHNGLDRSVRIRWTAHIANDREILCKIFETCPWGLDGVRVPSWLLKDEEMIRAFAQSASLRHYRETLQFSEDRVVCRFSLDLREHATLLIELVCQVVETKQKDQWACSMVTQHLRLSEETTDGNHIIRLVVGVAERMASVPWKEYFQHCPLQYRRLPQHLQGSREVVLAYIPLDANVTPHVPDALCNDADLWREAVQCTPRYENIQLPAPPPESPSKLYYLLLLEDAAYPLVETPRIYLIPDAAVNDRDVAMKYTVLVAHKQGILRRRIGEAFGHDRDFWLEVVEVHHCPVFAWSWIPEPIKADPAIAMAWARHGTEVDSLWLSSKEPEQLDVLLSDRQVLINCLSRIWSARQDRYRNQRAPKIWRHIDPTVLDYGLWLELVTRCERDGFQRLLLLDIKEEPAILRARLRSTLDDDESFSDLYCETLALDVQLQHLELLLEMIQGMDNEAFFQSSLYESLDTAVLHAPEVALALFSKGWNTCHDGFYEAVESAPWYNDPSFLMVVGERQLITVFYRCCPKILLSDKALVLRILRVDPRVWSVLEYMDDDGIGQLNCLKFDFDVLLCVLDLSSPDAILSSIPPLDGDSGRNFWKCAYPSERVVAFAREVRRRLTLYASIELVMMGTLTRPQDATLAAVATTIPAAAATTNTPLSLLDQDRYTKSNFRNRLVELLGAPSSNDDVATLRRVSNALTRYGF